MKRAITRAKLISMLAEAVNGHCHLELPDQCQVCSRLAAMRAKEIETRDSIAKLKRGGHVTYARKKDSEMATYLISMLPSGQH